MLDSVRRRLSYANVTATIALFVALGGSAYAVSQISGSSIKPRSIDRSRIARDALTGAEIREQSLKLRCPKGMRKIGRVCFEIQPRPAKGYFDAVGICSKAGYRLPSFPELFAGRGIPGYAAGGEYTSSVFESRNRPGGLAVAVVKSPTEVTFAEELPSESVHGFRCVTEASVNPG